MGNTVNTRVIMLKNELRLTDIDFCHRTQISTATLHRIKQGDNVTPKIINSIVSALNVSREWLVNGTGTMFTPEPPPAIATRSITDKAIELLEEQLKKKDEQINTLLAVLSKLNFPEPLIKTGVVRSLKHATGLKAAA